MPAEPVELLQPRERERVQVPAGALAPAPGSLSGLKPVGEGSSSEPWGRTLGCGFCVLTAPLDVCGASERIVARDGGLNGPPLTVPSVSGRRPLSQAEGRRAAARSLEANPGRLGREGASWGRSERVSRGRGLRTGPGLMFQRAHKGKALDEPGACVCERVMGMRLWEDRARIGARDLAQ